MPRASKASINNDYLSKGVSISPVIPTPGDNIKVSYDGILAKSGANDILAHVGYGNSWSNLYDYRMKKVSNRVRNYNSSK